MNGSMAKSSDPAPPTRPKAAGGPYRVAFRAAARVGTAFGLFDGLVRTLGIDPGLFWLRVQHQGWGGALSYGLPETLGELPALLGCTLGAAFLYGLGTGLGGLALAAVAGRVERWRPAAARARLAARVALAAWLFLEVYWWTRSGLLPGLSATDPRRLAASLGLLLACLALAWVATARARAPRPGRAWVVAALWSIGAGYLAVDRAGSGTTRGRIDGPNDSIPNVLVIVVDALRADVLGCYGHPVVKTPAIDRLAAEGVRFARARVQAPFTWPSFGSMLTGKYPRRHGLVRMEAGYALPDNVTLPSYLHQAALRAGGTLEDGDVLGGAFLTGTLSHGSGLAQGFDVIYEALVGHELVDVHSRWSAFRSGLLPWLYKSKLGQRFDSARVARTAAEWLRRFGQRRFLALVHFYSTHTPYDPPRRYRELYCDPDYRGPIRTFDAEHRIAIEEGRYVPTPEDVRAIRDLYWAGTTQADDMIGEVVEELRAQGVLDDTIVVVTADHGESLGEHGLWEHDHMYQDNLAVPLVMRWPKGLPQGLVVEPIVESIDLLPTLLELMGVAPLPAARDLAADAGHEQRIGAVDGTSLVPLIEGRVATVKRFSFAENGRYHALQDERWKLVVRREQLEPGGWERMLAAGAEERRTPAGELPRLFDLEADPGELVNLFERPEHAALVEELRAELARWSASLPIRGDLVRRSDRDLESERALLRGLGYAEGVGEEPEPAERAGSGTKGGGD